jgi:antitoxin ParD1/3/4
VNVSLTPELEKFVSAKVGSGRYNSASEVVREALRLLEEHDTGRARLQHKSVERRKPRV